MANNRNADVLLRIISYCNEISETIQRFGEDYIVFAQDSLFTRMLWLFV